MKRIFQDGSYVVVAFLKYYTPKNKGTAFLTLPWPLPKNKIILGTVECRENFKNFKQL